MKIEFPRPYPKQIEFFKSEAKYTAYGGARGGGKSYAAREKAILLCYRYAGAQVLFLRRTYPELKENHLLPTMLILKDAAKYNGTDKAFVFPNGSRLKFGYCQSDKDILQYQGQAYDFIFLEEATQFPEKVFTELTPSNRPSGLIKEPVKCRMFLTCNPGGIGHTWVKRLFIDRDFKDTESPNDYKFIKSLVYDNEYIMQYAPDYVKVLENLPEDRRRAFLEGDWDIFEGQYFPEFRREQHVVQPFTIPVEWRRYRVFDYGLDMFACYFIAVDYEGFAYVYKEIYEGKDLGEGHNGLIISEACSRMKAITERDEDFVATIAPPDMWNRQKDTGRSAAEIFAENRIFLTKSENSRVQGWLDVKEWLKPTLCSDGNKYPKIRIFENCINLIRTLPQLQHSPKDPNDVANDPHEFTHGPDAIRYFCAARPLSAEFLRVQDEDEYSYDEQMEDFLNYG